jgi:DNA-directed RNA polymerase specialized sigma24 family protein
MNPPANQPDPEETELFRRSQAGDLDALTDLSERFRPALVRHAAAWLEPLGNADSEDLVQDALLRLCLRVSQLRNVQHFQRSAFKIVERLALDRKKIFKNHRTTPLPESFEGLNGYPDSNHAEDNSEWRLSLLYVIEEMKPLTKKLGEPCHAIAVWLLDRLEADGDLASVREIAAHWQLGHGTAQEYRSRILASWRQHLSLYGLDHSPSSTP